MNDEQYSYSFLILPITIITSENYLEIIILFHTFWN